MGQPDILIPLAFTKNIFCILVTEIRYHIHFLESFCANFLYISVNRLRSRDHTILTTIYPNK